MNAKERIEIRQAVADYMSSEGCSCCRDIDGHNLHKEKLAKLLGIKKYSDGSGYDFSKHTTTVFTETIVYPTRRKK